MNRTLLSLISVFMAVTALAAEPRQPNVVVILADDQGWGDLSIHGNTNLRTPHIDSIGKEGAVFDRFFVQPVCSPTRAEFLTGRYAPRCGVRNVTTGGERLDLDEKTIADAFKAAGYATAAFGKWHNGSQYPYHPNGRGFEEYYGFTSGHWGDYFSPPLDHNGVTVKGNGFLPDDITDHAVKFITSHKAKPFLCYLAFNTPHSPMQVPDDYWRRFEKLDLKLKADPGVKEDVPHTRAALAMCENLDDNVGRVLKTLDDLKLTNDTIVIYFSDNGPNGWRWNDGMKGRKGSTDEGGVRSPLLVRWPNHIKAGSIIKPIAAAIDLHPTLLDLAGVKAVNPLPFDGDSLAPLLFGKTDKTPDRMLFQHWAGKISARTRQYRFDAVGKLFDMSADPAQTKDVSADHADIVKSFTEAVERWKKNVLAELPKNDERPYPVGHPAFPVTVLPARDGVPHGGVKRSSAAPNCSYFTEWKTTDDSMTWDVDIATAGKYEAVIHYTCLKGDVNSVLEMTLNGVKWTGQMKEAHDPPLRGKDNDRVPRTSESYMKDFSPLSLGVVDVPAGRGPLTLRAVKVPGQQVADVRAIVLTLMK
jgi:arylsulfatase A-like enzyme